MKPRHVAIILDGNRRYARKRGLAAVRGHEFGLAALRKIVKGAVGLGIEELTFYVFSAQNLGRSRVEVHALFALIASALRELREDSLIELLKVRVRFIGSREPFPAELRRLMEEIEKSTAAHAGPALNLALGYGGREELVDAIRRMCREVKQGLLEPSSITESAVTSHLWLRGEPDVVIRTGGDVRTSNFLPWQTIYSEWFFEKKLWPEFTMADLRRIIREFEARKRRFGK